MRRVSPTTMKRAPDKRNGGTAATPTLRATKVDP